MPTRRPLRRYAAGRRSRWLLFLASFCFSHLAAATSQVANIEPPQARALPPELARDFIGDWSYKWG